MDRIRKFFADQTGTVSVGMVLGGLCLVVAYLLYPEPFHNFVRYLLDTMFNVLHESFNTPDKENFHSDGVKEVTPGSAGGKNK